jgi:hypothetical protein
MTGCWRLLNCLLEIVAFIFSAAFLLAPVLFGLALIAPPTLGQQVGDRSVRNVVAIPPLTALRPRIPRDTGRIDPIVATIEPPLYDASARIAPAFRHLVRSAGIIFAGQVVSVGRTRSFRTDPREVDSFSRPDPTRSEITFLVEHGLRGVSTGERFTIHEWSGLSPRSQSYYVGERLLLFLYAPSELGFTSPIAGNIGSFSLDTSGGVVMNAQQIAEFAEDSVFGGRKTIPYFEFALAVRRLSGSRP